jgi:hypothetical protein
MAGIIVTPVQMTVAFTATQSYSLTTLPSKRQYVLDNSNPQYVRNSILTNDGLYLQYYTGSVCIPLSNLYQQASYALGSITAPPTIITQPTSSTVTHPATAYFVVSASVEANTPTASYQWYSSSVVSVFLPLTSSGQFTGSTGSALTCSNTSVSMSNSQYICVVSNLSGMVSSSIATLTVN